MRRALLLVAITGCGRMGFGELDASGPLDPIDAPAGAVVARFGETSDASFQGVTVDTTLSNESRTLNYGADTRLPLEGSEKRALIRFDVTALPASTTVAAARLHLWVSSKESGAPTITLAPITETWTEGSQLGAAGAANWTERTASLSWTTEGAGSPGSSGATIGSVGVPKIGAIGVDLPTATVQAWVNTPTANFGLVLADSGGDLQVSSSNAPTATERPVLVVTYFP